MVVARRQPLILCQGMAGEARHHRLDIVKPRKQSEENHKLIECYIYIKGKYNFD